MKIHRTFMVLALAVVFLLGGSLSILAAEESVTLQTPIAVTTCGQSPGALMIKLICKKASLDCMQSNSLSVQDLQENSYKTLIITTGTSMKGMGAAGTDINVEIKRIEALIAEAKKQGIVVIGAHIEGMSRRVDKYDQMSIETVIPVSDVILIKEDSDEDGYFSDVATEKNIPIFRVTETLELKDKFQELFKTQ